VVLTDGVQTVSPVVAQILQNAGATAGGRAPTVAPPVLANMPVVNGLDLSPYPDSPLNLVNIRDNPATCWWWERAAGENRSRVQVVSGPTIPVAHDQMDKVVSPVKGDDTGREADQVYFGPDYANFVAVTGSDPDAATTESLWWLSKSGARFGVENTDEALKALGLTADPSPAPWVALRLLANGPTLSRADALVRHDTLPTDMQPGELVVPK
jgi:type VII secretion protein EccB